MNFIRLIRSSRKRRFAFVACLLLGLPVLIGALAIANGTILARGNRPEISTTTHPAATLPAVGDEITIMSFNIAKAFVHRGGFEFLEPEEVCDRLDAMADMIRRESPDLVFLSEAIRDCGPCPVNQIDYLAEKAGMHSWAFGENYNVGLPFYRVAGGNAILSRFSISAVANIDLPGRQPFWVTKNNRRALIGSIQIAEQELSLVSIHNDSYSLTNNTQQARVLLDRMAGAPAICAGDFNAGPESEPMNVFRDSGRFSGMFDGAPTFPSEKPTRRIDYILAPKSWELIQSRVIPDIVSDHLAVVTMFRVR